MTTIRYQEQVKTKVERYESMPVLTHALNTRIVLLYLTLMIAPLAQLKTYDKDFYV